LPITRANDPVMDRLLAIPGGFSYGDDIAAGRTT
jgi:phosphoribosylformylglycinamidine (FGAM) synthase-like amidotransferase family enzyme